VHSGEDDEEDAVGDLGRTEDRDANGRRVTP
jgi:hypothetical protein